jgi:hypothetical protein
MIPQPLASLALPLTVLELDEAGLVDASRADRDGKEATVS